MSAPPAPLDRSAPPPPGPARPFSFPAFERRELEPGVVLMAAPSRIRPLVFLELVAPTGASLDPAGGAGLAALTAALLDEGTSRRSSREIAAAAERIGGYLAASTDWDTLSLASGVASPHTGAALDLAAEVLGDPTFPQEEVTRLKERSLAETRRRRAFPSVLAGLQFARALYGAEPYGRPLLGTEASISALDRAAVRSFYRDRVAPAPVTVIAAGDFDVDVLADRALAALGGRSRAVGRPAAAAPDAPREVASRVYLVDRPGAAQVELRVGHVGIARSDPDFVPLVILNSLLGGKFTSRLTLNLRERHGITYGVHSSFTRRRGPGPFTVSTAVATADTGRAIAEIRRELERLRDEPVPAAELAETQSYLLGVFPYTVQSLEGVAHRLREIAVHELPLDYWQRHPEVVRAVGVDELGRVAREHLRPDRLTIVAVGPEDQLRPQLEPFGEPIVWRPAEQPEPV